MKLAVVIPCFNEEEILLKTNAVLIAILQGLISENLVSADSSIVYVDDGSTDTTWQHISRLCKDSTQINSIKLSGNVGHQNALLAGVLTVDADVIVTMDADLQDDPNLMREMLLEHKISGYEIVYGVRNNRDQDTVFKRWSARAYYRLMLLLGVNLIPNHADYRLMGRAATEALRQYPEKNLFLRGLVPKLGFKTKKVFYQRSARTAGVSKYPLIKMFEFAWEGISSFSIVPLRIITVVGLIVFSFSALMGIVTLWTALVTGKTVSGWASTVLPVYFMGGIQILCLSLIGEYLAKIYIEVKDRPRYIIEKSEGLVQPEIHSKNTDQKDAKELSGKKEES